MRPPFITRNSRMGTSREVALGADPVVVSAGDFRVLTTRLPPGFRIPDHTHALHNLAYTVTGGVREAFGREQIQCRPGNVLFKPAGVLHSDFFESETVTLQVEWRPDASRAAGTPLDRVLLFRAGEVGALAARLCAELRSMDEATPLIAEGIALEILGRMVRGRGSPPEERVPRWLSRARERMHDEAGATLSIRELAAEAGVHADHLARRFRTAYGTTVGMYLRRLRLERAAADLVHTPQRLSEIALRAGFADQAHFTREFKRRFGVPPGAYRRGAVASVRRASPAEGT